MAFVPYKKKDKKHHDNRYDNERNGGKDLNLPMPEFKPMPSAKGTDLPYGDSEDNDQGPGLAQKIQAIVYLPFFVGVVWLKKAAVASWNGITWCGAGIGRTFGKVGSLFVRKPNDDEAESPLTEPTKLPTLLPKTVAVVDDPEFDDEEEKTSLLSVGAKLAALAALVLLGVGGYYGVKTYLVPSKKESVAQSSIKSTTVNEKEAIAPSVPVPANPPIANAVSKPAEKASEKPVVVAAPKPAEKVPEPPKTPEKTSEKPAVAATPKPAEKAPEPPKTPEKTPEKPAVAAASKPAEKAPEPPKTPEKTPEKPAVAAASKPIEKALEPPKTPEKTPEKPAIATAPKPAEKAPEPPKPAEKSPEKPALAAVSKSADDLWGAVAGSSSSPPAASTPPSFDGFPVLPSPDVQTPPVASTTATPLPPVPPVSPAPPALAPPPAALTPTMAESPPPLPSSQPLAPPPPPPDAEKPLSIPDPAATTLKPLTVPSLPPVASSFDVAEPKIEFPATDFSAAPTPPKRDASFAEPTITVPPINPPPTPEAIPMIPPSGAVEPILVSAPLPPKLDSEPTLGIPKDPITSPEPTTTFTVPSAPLSPPPYIPPPAAAPTAATATPSLPPLSPSLPPPTPSVTSPFVPSNLASAPSPPPAVSALPPMPDEPAIGISEPVIPPTKGNTPEQIIPIPPTTEQKRLAEALPPLGTQLQHEIGEARQANSATKELNVGTPPVTAMGGAVRYNPKTARNEAAPSLSMPSEPNNPLSNSLLALNPSENAPDGDIPGLPSLQSAPPAKSAIPAPSYQRPSNDSKGSATSYRQRAGREAATRVPDAKRYVVEPGDTYMTISTRFYETSLLYQALAIHNRRLGAAWLPESGTEIEIPPLEYLQKNYSQILARTGERSGLSTNGSRRFPSPIAAATSSARQGARYVVKEGDTVFKIAEERLKDTGRWKDIILWNSDQIQDPRDLRPGMEIVLPGTVSARVQ